MKFLTLKVPPLALVLIAASAMVLLTYALPKWGSFAGFGFILAAVFCLVGAVISVSGVRAFRLAKTTVNPMTPDKSSELVTQGIYQRTRNPMYVGFLCWLIALACFLDNPLTLVVCIVFVIYMNKFQIEPEEQALSALFEGQYELYQRQVRRWL